MTLKRQINRGDGGGNLLLLFAFLWFIWRRFFLLFQYHKVRNIVGRIRGIGDHDFLLPAGAEDHAYGSDYSCCDSKSSISPSTGSRSHMDGNSALLLP